MSIEQAGYPAKFPFPSQGDLDVYDGVRMDLLHGGATQPLHSELRARFAQEYGPNWPNSMEELWAARRAVEARWAANAAVHEMVSAEQVFDDNTTGVEAVDKVAA